jgi:hypothetical protein
MANYGRPHLDAGMMKFNPDTLVNILLLRPRQKSQKQNRHGTFNRRMIAASLDSLLVTALLAPLVDYMFIRTYGPATVTTQDIAQYVQDNATQSGEAARLFFERMKDTGFLDRWTLNFRWQMFLLCVYVTICWHYWAATPGKMICRLKIVDAKTGGPMGDWQSVLRVVGYFVSAIPFGLGFWWIAIDKKRRGWHDLIAGTVVIAEPWRKKKEETISAPESDLPSGSPAPSAAE